VWHGNIPATAQLETRGKAHALFSSVTGVTLPQCPNATLGQRRGNFKSIPKLVTSKCNQTYQIGVKKTERKKIITTSNGSGQYRSMRQTHVKLFPRGFSLEAILDPNRGTTKGGGGAYLRVLHIVPRTETRPKTFRHCNPQQILVARLDSSLELD